MPLSSRSAFALFVLGLLAPGLLPAQEPYLVRDINKRTYLEKGLTSREVLATTNDLFYSFDDGIHGAELWSGSGSAAFLVHDLCPGPCGSSPRDLVELGDDIYFFADDGLTGVELWRSDGSAGGAVLVRDLCPGSCSSWPDAGSSPVVASGNTLFFRARGSSGHVSLWTGNSTGARPAANICPGCDAGIYDLTAFGFKVFFRADDGEHGIELWSSDGTAAALFRDDCPGECSSGPEHDLPDLFTPYIPMHDLFYWQSVPGPVSRWRLRSVNEDPSNQDRAIELDHPTPPRLAVVGNALLLSISKNLMKIDVPTFTMSPFLQFGQPVGPLTAAHGAAFFRGYGPAHGFELWRTDGTTAGTQLVADTVPGTESGSPENLVEMEGNLYFTTRQGRELWRSDGTAAGTRSFKSGSTNGPASIAGLTPDPSRDSLLFTSGNPASQTAELWSANSSLLLHPARGIREIPGSADLRTLTAFGKTLFFAARDRLETHHPWRSDGTETGTEILSISISNPEEAAPFQGGLVFRSGTRIWKTDGTVGGTLPLVNEFAADHLKVAGDQIFFSGQWSTGPDAFTGFELWRSDGTVAGTRMIKDIVPGNDTTPQGGPLPRSSRPRQLTPVGSGLFFVATTPVNGTEVWFSDGTAEGTRLQADLCTGTCSSDPQLLAAFANHLVFTANSRDTLLSSGPAGFGAATLLKIGRSIPDPVSFQGRLFFFAEDTAGSEHLWSTDGTAPGTVRVGEVAGLDQPRTSHEPTVVGNRLYFTSWSAGIGQELWVSDGTAGGTSLFVDLRPGPQGSSPRYLTAAGDRLFLSADDGENGQELWMTDGTAAGTRRVGDVAPGPSSAAPADLTYAGELLFFSANDDENGRELWALDTVEPTEEPYTRCVPAAGRLCLHGGRFEVSAELRDPLAGGAAKPAIAVPDSDESGFFWFFAPDNLELVVKLLDGRSANGHFWVFFGALSDVEFTVTVADRATGAVKTYRNPRGTFCGQADTAAFPDPGEAAAPSHPVRPPPVLAGAAATGSCIPGPSALCLRDGRFRVEARWKDHNGLEGTATAVPRTGESGSFWFFSPGNTELVVKVLDGTPVNGKLWVFYGALSDVEYWLTVTDTATDAAKTWHNPPGSYCGRGDTSGL